MYIAKRLLSSIPIVIGMTLLSFLIMKWAPGDPTSIYMDPKIKAEDMQVIRHNLGLDRPILVQYGFWLGNIYRGNFGYSYITGKPVLTAITERLPATLLLSVSSLLIILLITFPLGLLSGAKKDSWFDHGVMIFSFMGMSLPTFWLGLMVILFFALKLNLFPTSGFLDSDFSEASLWIKGANIAYHMTLPMMTIVIGSFAGLTRYTRFGIISILNQDYIRAARSRGISENRILFYYAFKNAALPIVTILGMELPGLIGGAFIIEYIFSWPGLGQLGVNAVFQRDYPILMGTLLFSSLLIVIGNLLSDIGYSWVDPRIQKKS